MKKIFTKSILLSALPFVMMAAMEPLYAQKSDSLSVKSSKGGKYMVKINLLSLPLNNYSFQFERAIAKKIAFGVGVRYMPKSGIPLSSQVEKAIDDPESWDQIKDFQTGNLAISPELRFYMGKGIFRGFYAAPFARYSKYSAEIPAFNFDKPNSSGTGTTPTPIKLSGDLTTMTGGLLLGAQFKLSKLFYLDWSILGPQYGTSEGNITGKLTLSSDPAQAEEERGAMKKELEDFDLPMVKITADVSQDGTATANIKGPWAGIRSSFSLGIRF